MAKSKPMTEDAKARLKELAAAKKGRTTLAGLDVAGWSVAMDAILDDDPRATFPVPLIIKSGVLHSHNLTSLRYSYMREEKRRDAATPRTYFGSTITHVRLKGVTEHQRAGIIAWLGEAAAVPVVYQSYAGPDRGIEWRPDFLYPVAPMLRLFYAIWQGDWKDKAVKYMHGHTAGHVRYLSPWVTAGNLLPNQPTGWLEARAARRHAEAVDDLVRRGLMYDKPKPAA